MKKGKFIIIEGVDNAGKSTQSNLLKEYLESRGERTIQVKEPGGTPEGEQIRKLLLVRNTLLDSLTQTLLFYASRREFLLQVVKPALEQSTHVISDRFEASSFVYQGYTQGVPDSLLKSLHEHVVETTHCPPDIFIILDISSEESIKRRENKDNHHQRYVYEKQSSEFLEKLREGYLLYAKQHNITIIDGMQDKNTIHKQIVKLIAGI